MRTYTCTNCGGSVPSTEATLRSIAFRQVAYCRTCRDEIFGVIVPEQRASADSLTHTY